MVAGVNMRKTAPLLEKKSQARLKFPLPGTGMAYGLPPSIADGQGVNDSHVGHITI